VSSLFVTLVIDLPDRPTATVDVIAKFLETRPIIQNEIVDLVRFFQTPIRDLNRQLHDYLDSNALPHVEGIKNIAIHPGFTSVAMIETAKPVSPVPLSPNPISHVRRSGPARPEVEGPQWRREFPPVRQTTSRPFL